MKVNERVVLTAKVEGFIGGDPPSGVQVRLADGQVIQTAVSNLFALPAEEEPEVETDDAPKKGRKKADK